MNREIWVAGYPSFCGGADTELDHNIDLWLKYGVGVNLVPMADIDRIMFGLCKARGCETRGYQPDVFKDRVVVCFWSPVFLRRLPEIMRAGRPRKVIWLNCMNESSPAEQIAHGNGWIDYHGFNSNYQRASLKPVLERIAPVRELEGYRPFFNIDNRSQRIEFAYREPAEHFAIGRISRDDATKYPSDLWQTFADVQSPRPKKVFMLGYGPAARHRTGPPPAGLDVQTWRQAEIPVNQFYEKLHCLMYKTGGHRETYGRIVPECYAAGVAVVVEDDYAFPELVIDGVTGFRCKSSQEMSSRASELARDEAKRKKMIHAARQFLMEEIADEARCWKAWEKVLLE